MLVNPRTALDGDKYPGVDGYELDRDQGRATTWVREYSFRIHADSESRDQLEKHLSMLKRQGRIVAWHDRKITAGDHIDDTISEQLEAADIILLLVSSDFLASEYCYGVEVRRAMERSEQGEARVIPVILRPCDWKEAPFAHLLAAPTDGRPVSRWADRDEAWLSVTEAIKNALPPPKSKPKSSDKVVASVSSSGSSDKTRSSNLRIRKEFSDSERSRFLKDCFEFVARFFENSLEELGERYPREISSDFSRIDAQKFTAIVYRRGKQVSQCQIRLNPLGGGFGAGISFSYDATDRGNGFNENLSVEADDQQLFLKSLGMRAYAQQDRHLSQEGAAELFWEMFIEPLQR